MKILILIISLLSSVAAPCWAKEVVVTVNGEGVEHEFRDYEDADVAKGYSDLLKMDQRPRALEYMNIANLSRLIDEKIIEQAIRESRVSVSDAELEEFFNSGPTASAITPENLKEIKDFAGSHVKALKDYMESPERADEKYGKTMFGWDLLKTGASPERILNIEKSVPTSVEEWKAAAILGGKEDALRQKMEEKIAVSVSTREEKDLFIRDWWRDRFRSAKIVVKDERYKSILYVYRDHFGISSVSAQRAIFSSIENPE